jgi:anti-anti-sigma factor
MSQLAIVREDRGEVGILRVSGFMNIENVPAFEKHLADMIHGGKLKIILDFSALEYISSSGLGEIVMHIRNLRQRGGDIKIGGYSTVVYDTLKTFGFTDIFSSYSSCEEAVRTFLV